MTKPIIVAVPMLCSEATLLDYTQDPVKHTAWDIRYSSLEFSGEEGEDGKIPLTVSTRIGFGMVIKGKGSCAFKKPDEREHKEHTAALNLKFDDRRSLISELSGNWKYLPQSSGYLFATTFHYQLRWGWIGKFFDFLFFRSYLMGATKWSFCCLKRWVEDDIHPKDAIKALRTNLVSRVMICLLWLILMFELVLPPATLLNEITSEVGESSSKYIRMLPFLLFFLISAHVRNNSRINYFVSIVLSLVILVISLLYSQEISSVTLIPVLIILMCTMVLRSLKFLPDLSQAKTPSKALTVY